MRCRVLSRISIVVFVGALVVGWLTQRTDFPNSIQFFADLRRIVEQHTQPGDRVLICATSVLPAYPLLLQTDHLPGSRYAWSFPIGFYYGDARHATGNRSLYHRWQEAPAEEQQFLRELDDDVRRLQPQLIIISNGLGSTAVPKGFRIFDYLVYSGWAKDALAPYHKLVGLPDWKIFERSKCEAMLGHSTRGKSR